MWGLSSSSFTSKNKSAIWSISIWSRSNRSQVSSSISSKRLNHLFWKFLDQLKLNSLTLTLTFWHASLAPWSIPNRWLTTFKVWMKAKIFLTHASRTKCWTFITSHIGSRSSVFWTSSMTQASWCVSFTIVKWQSWRDSTDQGSTNDSERTIMMHSESWCSRAITRRVMSNIFPNFTMTLPSKFLIWKWRASMKRWCPMRTSNSAKV